MTLQQLSDAPPAPDLATWLASRLDGKPPQIAPAVLVMADAAARVAGVLARGPQSGSPGAHRPSLDLLESHAGLGALQAAGVAYLAAAGDDTIHTVDAHGALAVAVDARADAAAIEALLPAGALFTLFPASPDGAAASFLRCGEDILAAGYVVHGPHTALVITLGAGVDVFVLDHAAGVFRLSRSGVRIPAVANDFAIDVSNYRYWHHPVRLLVDDCMAGADGPRGADYVLRGTGRLVAETHRILACGGAVIDPPDHRSGRQSGGVRLVFEAFALALIAEQAGGAASDTSRRILSRTASDMGQHTPLVLGSAGAVKLVEDYHLGPTARLGEAPLFGRRGLYRK